MPISIRGIGSGVDLQQHYITLAGGALYLLWTGVGHLLLVRH